MFCSRVAVCRTPFSFGIHVHNNVRSNVQNLCEYISKNSRFRCCGLTRILPVTVCPDMHSSAIHLRRVMQPTRGSVLKPDRLSSRVTDGGLLLLKPVWMKCFASFHDRMTIRPEKKVIRLKGKIPVVRGNQGSQKVIAWSLLTGVLAVYRVDSHSYTAHIEKTCDSSQWENMTAQLSSPRLRLN